MLTDLLHKRREYAERDGERFLDAVAERPAHRQCRALLSRHVLRLARILEPARQPHVRNVEDAARRSMGQTARRSSGPTIRISAMLRRPRCSRAASITSAICAERSSATGAYAIGFGTHSGTVAAASSWDGPMEVKTVLPARSGSYESVCHDTGISSFLLNLHAIVVRRWGRLAQSRGSSGRSA